MTAAGEPFLPSARQAMRYAVELASDPTPAAIDLERARVWVTIAHELRIGERPAGPFPRPFERVTPEQYVEHTLAATDLAPFPLTHFGDESLLPVCEEVNRNDPEGALVVYDLRDVNCHACQRVVKERELAEQIAREDTPVARHAEYEAAQRPEDTVVFQHEPSGQSPLTRCGNCPHEIEIDLTNVPATWRHIITRQAVCPVRMPDQAHTFATPLVDARG